MTGLRRMLQRWLGRGPRETHVSRDPDWPELPPLRTATGAIDLVEGGRTFVSGLAARSLLGVAGRELGHATGRDAPRGTVAGVPVFTRKRSGPLALLRRRRGEHAPAPLERLPAAPAREDRGDADLPQATEATDADLPQATEATHADLPQATEATRADLPQATEATHADLPQATEATDAAPASRRDLPARVAAAATGRAPAVRTPPPAAPSAAEGNVVVGEPRRRGRRAPAPVERPTTALATTLPPPARKSTPATTPPAPAALDAVSRPSTGARTSVRSAATASHRPLIGARARSPVATEKPPPAVRAAVERAFGVDLVDVPVHRSGRSSGAATKLGAEAFAVRDEVHVPARHGGLESERGGALLAHELAHAAQHRRERRGAGPRAEATLEREARWVERSWRETESPHAAPSTPAAHHEPPDAAPSTPAPRHEPSLPHPAARGHTAAPAAAPAPVARMPGPSPSPDPSRADPVRRAVSPPADAAGAEGVPVDELVRHLYERIRSRLRAELLIDRERAGTLTDLRVR
ncbi:MAG: DUF4157 domain-containing protein [Actinomycetota bacterium]